MKTLHEASSGLTAWLLRRRRVGAPVRGGVRSVCAAMVGMALFVAIPFHSAIASDVQMDRVWELELQGRVQTFSPSRLTIEVARVVHVLSHDFEVFRDGRAVDRREVTPGAFVALDKRGGSVRRIFLMEEEPR